MAEELVAGEDDVVAGGGGIGPVISGLGGVGVVESEE